MSEIDNQEYRDAHNRMFTTLRWRQGRAPELPGDKAWRRWLDLYRGKHFKTSDGVSDPSTDDPRVKNIRVNLSRATVQDYLPFLVRKSLSWFFRPKNLQASLRAPVARGIMDHFWSTQGMQKQYRYDVLDLLIFGHCIGSTGYMLELDEPRTKKGGALTYDDFVKKDAPTYRRVNPFLFVFDRTAANGDLSHARWCGEFVFVPRSVIANTAKYNDKARKEVTEGGGASMRSFVSSFLSEAQEELLGESGTQGYGSDGGQLSGDPDVDDVVACFHFFDKQHSTYYFYAIDVMTPLVKSSFPYDYLAGFPYAKADLILTPNEVYGFGILADVEDQQHEVNRIRITEFNHRRKHALRKYVVLENNAISDTELQKLVSPTDEIIKSRVHPDMAVSLLKSPDLPRDNYAIEQQLRDDWNQLTGGDALLAGGNLPSRTSAREISARQSNVSLKASERVAAVDMFAEEIGRQLYAHLRANLKKTQLVKVIGATGAISWSVASAEDIRQEYDMEVLSTTKEDASPDVERAQRLEVMQVVANNAEILSKAGAQVDWIGLMRFVMEGFQRPELDTLIIEAPPQELGPEQGSPEGVDISDAQQVLQEGSVAPESASLGGTLGG